MARKSKEASEQINLTEQSNFVINKPNTEQEYQAVAAVTHSQCGGALRTARENQGLSVHEIASRLRLSPKQIEAIESDNFAVLPEPTIVRGFIRNYAKQLKINAQPLLDAYVVIVPSVAPHGVAVKPTSGMKMSSHEKSKSGSYALAALALLLGLGVWLFYQHYIQKPSPTEPSASTSSTVETAVGEAATGQNAAGAPVQAVLPEAALPVAERAAEPVTSDTQTTTALTLPAATGSPAASLPPSPATATVPANIVPTATNDTAASNVPAPVVKSPNTQSSNSQLPNSQMTASTTLSAAPVPTLEPPPVSMPKSVTKLEFNASQETWVNVVDINGKEVYSKIIFAGSRESIDVKPPVNVTVGNAGATSMSMNGKDVDLAPHSRNNVAHIKLDK